MPSNSAMSNHCNARQSFADHDSLANMEKEASDSDSNQEEHELMLNDEDVWDDSLLIQMYEDSQKMIHQALSNKNYNKIDNNEHVSRESVEAVSVNITNYNVPSQTHAFTNRTPKKHVWKCGDFCRAIYSEDGIEYEATIKSMGHDHQTCHVRYVGYGNEETQNIVSLKPSLGSFARKLQAQQAHGSGFGKVVAAGIQNKTSMFYSNPSSTSYYTPMNIETTTTTTSPSSSSARQMLPPMPSLKTIQSNVEVDEDDALASMLMSWYMSGYHTGYYQARKDISICKCQQSKDSKNE